VTTRSRIDRYIITSSTLFLRRDDVLLASFPRAGSTWVRLFLCNLISLSEWNGREVSRSVLNATMPRLGHDNLFRLWPHTTIPRVIRAHRNYSLVFARVRSIGILRDPRDVMVSFYHFTRDRRQLHDETFTGFIRNPNFGLEKWFRHYLSWRDHWKLTLKYEEMLQHPEQELNRVVEFLGVTCEENVQREAVARASFRKSREVEKSNSPAREADALFFRRGSSGQWHAYFSDDDLAYYHSLAAKYGARIYA
jgi:estrone sulfotransferase